MQLEPTILVAEDSDDDFLLLAQACEANKQRCQLQRAREGEEAIGYLAGEGRFADRQKCPLPSLLLLDLKMPNRDGFDVLHWRRDHPDFHALPVIVLSSSNEPADLVRAYALGANSCLRKPGSWRAYRALLRSLGDYWLGLNEPAPAFSHSRLNWRQAGERQILETAMLTICDPRGNWEYGWKLLCGLAEMDPNAFTPPFRQRTDQELSDRARVGVGETTVQRRTAEDPMSA